MLITSAADFLLYFFLVPETRGKKLPDNMPGEQPTLPGDSSQCTEAAKVERYHSMPASTSRQSEKSSKMETEAKTGGDSKESGRDEDKEEKRTSVGDYEEMEEKEGVEGQRKSTEDIKLEQNDEIESRGSERGKKSEG